MLGEGGMGSVYKAVQMNLNRKVAIKILDSSLDDEFIERFDKESQAIAKLVHQNIVQIYSKGVTEEGFHYFAMEYVEGEYLTKKLKGDKRFTVEEVIDIIIQTCRGLESAHEKDVIHRDIKPSNIMITKNGVVKITDFGLAKCIDESSALTRVGTFVGTPFYSSPEHGMGKPLDRRADVYSLGIVLYRLLTRKLPFVGDTTESVLYQHVHVQPTGPKVLNPKISSGVEAVVLKAIAKERRDRYQNMDEFREALEAARQALLENIDLETIPIKVLKSKVDSGIYGEKALTRKRNTIALVVVPLLLILIGGTTWYFLFYKTGQRYEENLKYDKIISDIRRNTNKNDAVEGKFTEFRKKFPKSKFIGLITAAIGRMHERIGHSNEIENKIGPIECITVLENVKKDEIEGRISKLQGDFPGRNVSALKALVRNKRIRIEEKYLFYLKKEKIKIDNTWGEKKLTILLLNVKKNLHLNAAGN